MTTQLSPLRKGRITASRAPIILGLSPYQDRDGLLREMVRQHFDAVPEFNGNDLTEWGNAHEEDARAAYEMAWGVLVLDAQDFIVHPEFDWLGVSPDGLVGTDGLVEFKCPPPRRGKWTSFNHKPNYLAQIQFQLACTGRAWCDGVIWRPFDEAYRLGCEPLIIERYVRDPDWLPANLPALAEFHREFLAIIADPDLAAPYLEDTERSDEEWATAAREFHDADLAAEEAGKRLDAAKARLRELAGDRSARGCGVTVTVTDRAGTVDWKRIAEKYAPDADPSEFRKASSRVVTVRSVQ